MLEWQFAEACSEKMLYGGIKLVVAVVGGIQGVLPFRHWIDLTGVPQWRRQFEGFLRRLEDARAEARRQTGSKAADILEIQHDKRAI